MEKMPRPQEFIKQEITEGLRRLKTDYKDGIPDEIKHSVSKDTGWKVQRGVWFQVVSGRLIDIVRKSLAGEVSIPKELFDEILAYHKKLTSDDNPLKHRLTTQEDIDEAEIVIDKAIAELEK
jgi:hypothetical protein